MLDVILAVILIGLAVVFGCLYVPDLIRLIRKKDPEGNADLGPFILAIAGLMSAVLAGAFGVKEATHKPPPTADLDVADPGVLSRSLATLAPGEPEGWKLWIAYGYMLFYVLLVLGSLVAVARASTAQKDGRPEVRAIAWGGLGVLIAIARNALLG